MKKKVFVALSGGVDSTVSAALLKEQGYDVKLVYMKNWEDLESSLGDECPWREDLKYVEDAAEILGLDYMIYNFEKEYAELVMEDFYREYAYGNTPNPDILCNKYIKFDAFLNRCMDDRADLIATGHYARTKGGKLYKGLDQNKDQTYFLAGLKEDQLVKVLFPIGDLQKNEVRAIAKKYGFKAAERKDSQGICFVGKVKLKKFLAEKLKPKDGNIVDLESKEIVGNHQGVWFYTNGQRKGLEIGGLDNPYFVHSKDVEMNTLFVVKGKDNPLLWEKNIEIDKASMINDEKLTDFSDLEARIRYRGELSKVDLIDEESLNKGVLHFEKPQWAPASGQSVVFYSKDRCLGLAKIA